MAGSQTSALISFFRSMKWVIRISTLSKNEAVFVLTGVAIVLAIRTRMDAKDFIAKDALFCGTEVAIVTELFDM